MSRSFSRALSAALLSLLVSLMLVMSVARFAHAAPARPVATAAERATAVRAEAELRDRIVADLRDVRTARLAADRLQRAIARRGGGCEEELARWYQTLVVWFISNVFQPWSNLTASMDYVAATEALGACIAAA
jgi:hypothetical protein